MSVTAKNIIPAQQLTDSLATYYTVPVNTRTIIKKLTFMNDDTVARTVTLHLIASGGSATAGNKLLDAVSVAAGDTFEATEAEGHVMEASGFLQASADAASQVSIRASGVEVV